MDGLKVGGYKPEIDYERLGQTLVVAASVILAIRTAKVPKPVSDPAFSNRDLEAEIDTALAMARDVLVKATVRWPGYFKHKDVPWWEPDRTDVML